MISGPYFLVFSSNTGKYRPENNAHSQSCSYQNTRHGALYIFLNFSCKLVCGMYFSNQRRRYKWTASKCWRINSMLPLSLSNQPLLKIHGIAYINFNCFVIDESSERNQAVLGLFFSRFMLGTISRLLRRNPCVNFIIKWRLPFCANFQVIYIPRPIKHLWWKSRWCYMIPVDWDELLSCPAGILAVL